RNKFKWESNLNFSLNRNKIVSITGEIVDIIDDNGKIIGQAEPNDVANGWFIGQDKDVIWDYRILGTWKTGEEEEAKIWNQSAGDFKLEDLNEDGILTDTDKQFIGYRTPRFHWTLTNNFNLNKSWSVS